MNASAPSAISVKLADRLRSKGITLTPKHNTIFTSAVEYGRYSELTVKALEGLVRLVTRDVNMFRNEIIPAAEDMAKAVKIKSKLASVNIADRFNFIIHNRAEGLSILTDLKLLDVNINGSPSELPSNPLIIEYVEDVAKSALNHSSIEVTKHIESILLEHDKNYVVTLHDKYLSNISVNNPHYNELSINPHDSFILYMLVEGFLNSEIGIANMPYEKAKIEYLYKLRNILISALKAQDSVYSARLSSGILVSKVVPLDKGKLEVHLIGENYDKYLETCAIEGIMGAVLTREVSQYRLDEIVSEYARYTEVYESKLRLETIKAGTDRINLIRQVYKIVAKETAESLQIDYSAVSKYADEYLNGLSNNKLLDTTMVCRVLAAYYLYQNEEFFVFADAMEYYSKLSPKSPPEEIATMAMVSLTVHYLKRQYTVTGA